MEEFTGTLIQAGFMILVAAVGLVAQKITAYFKKEGILTELESKKAYAKIVVEATQQMYQAAEGPEKLQRAKTQLVDYLQTKKIPFTEAELETLIESTVKSMKDGIATGLKEEK
ncbi:phage holin, LLH family [Enterococcus nangangensis]|uniref:phage holin, LLH family n=1 Tax=Enterococcus nangangensis TaxID=2559926 RepID=UPI0010F98181|nr:phage holin, LLH family [Enterococcus nangangensis]